MGLKDIVDDASEESDSTQSRKSGSESYEHRQQKIKEEHHKVVGTPPKQKAFSKEKWQDVKKYIRNHMSLTVNEILHSPADERHEMLHEAALGADGDLEEEDKNYPPEVKCAICGKDAEHSKVELEGETFHVHHSAGQVASELGKLE